MAVYHVSYDLNRQGQNYQGLWAELAKTEHKHILDSTWLVSTKETPVQLRDRLKKHLDSNDFLLVSKLKDGEYDGWLPKDVWDWIRPRL